MAWRFEPGEDLRKAFGRVAEEEIARVRAGLAGEKDRARAIHEARQGFKRLRALARLAAPALGERFAVENRRWRDAGRLLSVSRDRTVLMESFDKAVAELDIGLSASAVRSLRKRIVGDEIALDTGDVDAKIAEVLGIIDAALEELAAVDWPDSTEVLTAGLERSQKRLRKSWREAKKSGSPEALHEWRKRVKDQSAQLRLFRNVMPPALVDQRSEAKQTAEHLGEEHDLWLLSERAAAESVPSSIEKARERLLQAIEKRRTVLRRLAFERGKPFSSKSAKSFAGEVCDAWKAAATRTGKSRRKKPRPAETKRPATSQAR